MNEITVLVADDHTVVRESFKLLLESDKDIKVVGEAENGRDAVVLAEKLKPDVVLMDIGMPVLNGIEATRIIKKQVPSSKIVILSMYPDEEYVYEAIDAGASGYLVKETASEDLLKAMHEVSEGKAYFNPIILKTVLDRYRKFSKAANIEQVSDQIILLSQREREVLQLIAEGNTSKDIAEQLYISVKTVTNHRQNIMRKLNIHDIAGLTRYALNKGIIHNN